MLSEKNLVVVNIICPSPPEQPKVAKSPAARVEKHWINPCCTGERGKSTLAAICTLFLIHLQDMLLFEELDISKLVTIGNQLYLKEVGLITVSAPALTTILGFCTIDSLPLLASVSFGVLQQTSNFQLRNNPVLNQVSCPLLESVGSSVAIYGSALSNVSFPSLKTVGTYFNVYVCPTFLPSPPTFF